jgi:uncharacterized protein (TIGR02246 family)
MPVFTNHKPEERLMSAATTAEKTVTEVLDAMYAAWADADADGIARLYTEDATVTLPGVYHVGREAVRAWFTAGFAGRLKGSTALDKPVSVRLCGPDVAIITSQGGVLMAGETEVPAGRTIRATWVLSRQDSEWLIAAYHNCPAQTG